MGKSQVLSPTPADGHHSTGSTILKIKNCNNCGAEYARKGTLCGSCRGIRHRLLKKERERKSAVLATSNSSSPPPVISLSHSSPALVVSSPSVSPVTPLPTISSLTAEDTYVELPPIHIPIPARTKESQRDRLVSSISSCSRCDSNLDCSRCFLLDREIRRLNQERLDLQKQLGEMEIEIHAMRLQLMNEMKFSVAAGFSSAPTGIRPQLPSPTQPPIQFCFSPQVSSSSYQEPAPIHGVSVCQLVN